MLGSLYTGISGVNSYTQAMAVVGDNIANVNTTGFKSSMATFETLLSQTLGNAGEVGRGVRIGSIRPSWAAGTMENTTSLTDLAINGTGLFILKDEMGTTTYSRAGVFQFNKLGELVNSADGKYVQGYSIDATGALGAMGKIQLPSGLKDPKTTTNFSTNINLDSRTVGTAPITWTPAVPGWGTTVDDYREADYSSTLTIYDSLGNAIPLTLYFKKDDVVLNEWEVAAVATVNGAMIPVTVNGGTSTPLNFDSEGNLTTAADVTFAFNPGTGANPMSFTWNIAGNKTITQFGTVSTIMSKDQNGYTAGTFAGVSIEEGGIVTVMYSNGQLEKLAHIALADFQNYAGLRRIGGNQYVETLESGQPNENPAGTNGTGDVTPYSLEMSNVDLSTEFVKMITNQRAFQANCKVITTSDEILAELMMIKR